MRWPQDYRLYVLGFFFILFSKRYKEARDYIGDTGRRPRLVSRELAEYLMRTAEALAAGRGFAEFENGFRTQSASAALDNVDLAASSLALFGMVDELFALLEAYYFGGVVNGTRVAPPGSLHERESCPLFAPLSSTSRADRVLFEIDYATHAS